MLKDEKAKIASREIKRLKRKEKQGKKRAAERGQFEIGLQKMAVPRNEQLHFLNVVDGLKDKHKRRYAACLIGPEYTMSRVPDSFARPTALVRSKQIIQVPVWLDDTNDSGRFSVNIKAALGSLKEPATYKCAMVDSSNGWPLYLNQAGSFITQNNGRDIRLDPFVPQLTQPELASATYINSAVGGTNTSLNPFGAAVTQSSGYGLTVQYYPSQPQGGTFFPPPGLYRFTISLQNTGTDDVSPTIVGVNGAVVSFDISSQSSDNLVNVTAGYVYIPPPTDSSTSQGGLACQCSTIAQSAFQTSIINFTSTFDDNAALSPSFDYGAVAAYRTVAMSALATYTGPMLTNGGSIAAGYMPANTSKTQFFGSSAASGDIDNWENLATLKGTYNGPLKDGAYTWWSPEEIQDYSMLTPDKANGADQPTLVISGQFVPGTVAPAPGTRVAAGSIVRLEVTTVYEFLTESQLWESQYLNGSQAIMDDVMGLLAAQPHAMQNKTHMDFIKSIVKGVGKIGSVLYKNKDTLLPIGRDIASLLL